MKQHDQAKSHVHDSTSLVLYHTSACPYSLAARRAMDKLNIDIELRDIYLGSKNMKELIAGGGKRQVPCLRIDDGEGEVQWLYESSDIIKYLNTRKKVHSKVA